MYSRTFQALINEASFTSQILKGGIMQLRKANYAEKGFYFLAFSSLATGLERIGKLCVILDHYIQNLGTFPSSNYLKKKIGHDLVVLYQFSKEISCQHTTNFSYLTDLDNSIHQNIISILSEFAKGDRYSNIEVLTAIKQNRDPILNWHRNVDAVLFKTFVSEKRQLEIQSNAELVSEMLSHTMLVRHTSDAGEPITEIENASYLTGMTEAVLPFRQLFTLQIIRYWVELLSSLQYSAMELTNRKQPDIPYLDEVFTIFSADDNFLKKRKDFYTL